MKLALINQKLWTVGLRWSAPVKRRVIGHKNLLEMARVVEEGFDVAAARRCRSGIQYGFSASGDSWARHAGAPALCACLELPDSFLGLFCLQTPEKESFWWLHLRIDGVTAAFGDHVLGSAEEAREFLSLMESVSGMKAEVNESPGLSAEWLSEHLRYKASDKLVAKGQLSHLGKMASRHTVRGVSAIAAILLLCIGAGVGWSHHVERATLETARRERAVKQQRKAEMENHPEKFFDMAWQSRPLATDFAAQCLPAMMGIPLASNGWALNSVSCDGKKVSVQWGHEGGADFTRLPEGSRLDEKDLRRARSSTPVKKIPVSRPDGPGTDHKLLLTRDEALGLMAEITQTTGTKLSAPNFKTAKSKTIDKVTIHAPWREASWELSGIPDLLVDAHPGPDGISLFGMLSEIPGLSLDSISYNDGWSIRGKIHARQ